MTSHGDNQVCTGLILQLGGQLSVCKVGVAIAAVVVLQHTLFQAGSLKALAGRSDVVAGHGDVQAQTSLVFHLHSALGICKVGVAIATVVVLDDALFQAGSLKAFAGRSDVVCSQLALGLTAALTSSCLGAGRFAECVAQSCNVVVSIAQGAAFTNIQIKTILGASRSNSQLRKLTNMSGRNDSFLNAAAQSTNTLHQACLNSRLNDNFPLAVLMCKAHRLAFGLTADLTGLGSNASCIDPGMTGSRQDGLQLSTTTANSDDVTVSSASSLLTLGLSNINMLAGCQDHFAFSDLLFTVQAVGIASVAIGATGSIRCTTDLSLTMAGSGQDSLQLCATAANGDDITVNSASSLLTIGLSSINMLAGCQDHFAISDLLFTVQAVSIASVAIGATGSIHSVNDLSVTMAGSRQDSLQLSATSTNSNNVTIDSAGRLLTVGLSSVVMITGSGNDGLLNQNSFAVIALCTCGQTSLATSSFHCGNLGLVFVSANNVQSQHIVQALNILHGCILQNTSYADFGFAQCSSFLYLQSKGENSTVEICSSRGNKGCGVVCVVNVCDQAGNQPLASACQLKDLSIIVQCQTHGLQLNAISQVDSDDDFVTGVQFGCFGNASGVSRTVCQCRDGQAQTQHQTKQYQSVFLHTFSSYSMIK